MQLPTLKTAALAIVVLAVSGMILPTGAAPGGGSDSVWDEPAIALEPADGPNGQYATIGGDGNLSVDLPGVTVGAITVVRDVFTITNTESESYEIWVSHDAAGTVQFFVGGDRSIEDSGNPLALSAGEARRVSLVIDSQHQSADERLMSQLTLHAQQLAPTPTPTPSGGGGSGSSPAATATPTPTDEESVEVRFDVGVGQDPPGSAVTVREMSVSELDSEDPEIGPRAIIDRSVDEVTEADDEGPVLRANDVDAIAEVGQPVNLSGSGSLFGQADAIDSQRRIVKLVDIQVPEERRDQPGIVRITIARHKLGGTDPHEASLAHRTAEGWELLDTHVESSSAGTVTLQARTSGFSPFAVFVQKEVSYRWVLPDGTSAETDRIRSQFDTPGVYNVTLTVTDALGRSDTAVYRVLVNDRPTVAIEGLANASGDGPTTLRANVTNDVGNVTVLWTFADGSTAAGQTVTHDLDMGETVRVDVEDEFGAEGHAEGIVGRAPGDDGWLSIGVMSFNLGFWTRLAVVGLVVILLVMWWRWLAPRRYRY